MRPIAVVVLVGGLVAAFYLLLYPIKRYPNPIGWDTPRYLLQTAIAGQHGLRGVPSSLPPPGKTLTSRAAFPVLALTLSGLFRVSTFKVAETLPIAAATASALAAAAVVSASLRRRTSEFAVVGLLVGISPVLIRLMAPETYSDNLFLMAIFTAALVPLLFVARDGAGYAAAIPLLAAAALAHSAFFAAGMAVLVVLLVLFVPESLRARRDGAAALATPSARLGIAMAGGTAAGAAVMFGLLRRTPDSPRLSPGELSKKLREDLGLYAFPVTAPLAALGLGTARREARGGSFGARYLWRLLAAWTLVVLAGLAAFAFGANVPAHRFLASFLALPIAAALGVLAVAAWLERRSGRSRGRAWMGVAAVAVVGLGAFGAWEYYAHLPAARGVEWIEYHRVQDTANAAAYLDAEHVPAGAPVVFVIDDLGDNPLSNIPEVAYIVRAGLPANRVEHSWFYAGNPETYLAGRPTLRTRPRTYDANSLAFWRPLQRMLDASATRPVALLLNHASPAYAAVKARHPDWEVAPGVIVLEGPRPATPLGYAPAPWGLRTVPEGVAVSLGTFAVLVLVGSGWTLALLPVGLRSFEVAALALPFGFAFVILAGVGMDGLGVRLGGGGGAATLLVAAGAGWALAAIRSRRGRGAAGGDGGPAFPAGYPEPQP